MKPQDENKNGTIVSQNGTSKLYTSESQAKPMPHQRQSRSLNRPYPRARVLPMPAPPGTNVEDLASLVLNHLEKFWSCRKIPGDELRLIIAIICGKKSSAVWKLLSPAHIVKLHTTDCFILRDDKRRPKGYEGLVDDAGVLPSDEPAPF